MATAAVKKIYAPGPMGDIRTLRSNRVIETRVRQTILKNQL
jgi:hypothetical protein